MYEITFGRNDAMETQNMLFYFEVQEYEQHMVCVTESNRHVK